ncbi:MAG: hypothetical protein P8Y02_06045 [Deinococcales bacterium]
MPIVGAGGCDEAHDLLRRLGDLSAEELAERCVGNSSDWLEELERQGRAAKLR